MASHHWPGASQAHGSIALACSHNAEQTASTASCSVYDVSASKQGGAVAAKCPPTCCRLLLGDCGIVCSPNIGRGALRAARVKQGYELLRSDTDEHAA